MMHTKFRRCPNCLASMNQDPGELEARLAAAEAAARCFVRMFQLEGGIVTDEDITRWPWIDEFLIKGNGGKQCPNV